MKSPAETLNFRQSLLEFLEAGPGHEEALLEEFERKKSQGDPLYSSLLYLLTHLNFTERQAARHWKKILTHRDTLRAAIGRDPGLRVAILDYFVNVSRELRNPKVIELQSYERTERSAVTDGLTGLYNHSFFLQALRQEVLRSKRHGLRAALLLLDLDNFKQVNDERGHVEGDRVLMRAAAVVREGVREIDVAARYGGEEFAVLLPDTSRLGAFVVAERIRRRIEERFARGRSIVTISGGIAVFPDDAGTPADLIVQADAGLYGAKAAGKNRILLPQGERRRFRRQMSPQGVTVATRAGRAPARVKNVSEGGLLVSLREAVPLGSAVSLTIERIGTTPVGLRGQVVRVERVPGEIEPAFDVGVRFLDPGDATPLLTTV
ncbi:MAG TPA: diguanylate cyclase [Vicinamibacteria bacterium]